MPAIRPTRRNRRPAPDAGLPPVGLVSVNVAEPRVIGVSRGPPVLSGIDKHPVTGISLYLDTLNLDGDRQADLRVHGGSFKAVFAYPAEASPALECGARPGKAIRTRHVWGEPDDDRLAGGRCLDWRHLGLGGCPAAGHAAARTLLQAGDGHRPAGPDTEDGRERPDRLVPAGGAPRRGAGGRSDHRGRPDIGGTNGAGDASQLAVIARRVRSTRWRFPFSELAGRMVEVLPPAGRPIRLQSVVAVC